MGEIDELINYFPGLSNDKSFCITSPKDRNYNCIAWAYGLYKDRWMQFDTRPRLDGVWYWWPEGVSVSQNISSYIEAFKAKGFDLCDSHLVEEGFLKVALYVKDGTKICTHAARQKRNGTWMSKLGREQDIVHDSPFSIQGSAYGSVYCIMKLKR